MSRQRSFKNLIPKHIINPQFLPPTNEKHPERTQKRMQYRMKICFTLATVLFDDSYLTIKKNAEGVYKDRGSKFLAFAFPVKTEQEVKEILTQIKKEHHGANHHCYAWRLGPDKLAYRANDDGEPNNSAGKPILGQIQSNDLTDIFIVVARYFGGTLLGVSGLINAYREAAADAIKNAEIITKHVLFEYETEFAFEQMNSVMRILKECDAKIISQNYESNCLIKFYIRKNLSEKAEEALHKIPVYKLIYLNTL